MEKVNLTKSELALLDALIADMQEEGNESSVLTDSAGSAAFIGGFVRVARRAFKLAARVTPVATRAAGGIIPLSSSGTDEGTKMMSDDGESLSVDQLIELRKAAKS